ncbi:MAG: hypothetical protein ACYC7D_11025 [Nitrososphaerales archaeon]
MKLDKTPTQTKSFRLDADILEALDMESARRGTSVNNLTNQILRKWVNFDRYVQDFGYVMFSVHDFLRGLNTFDDSEIRNLATESGRRFPKDLILFTGQKTDIKTCIRFVESIFCDYMKWATYHNSSTDAEYVITLRHNYGSKWSIALESTLLAMFDSNASVKPRFTVTDSTVLMMIQKPIIPQLKKSEQDLEQNR